MFFITSAYAQSSGSDGGSIFSSFIPLILIGLIFWFLLIRPQRQAARRHEEKLAAIRRNDTIITNGGLVGKVTKIMEDSGELEVSIAPDVRVRVIRSMIADVRVKGDPVSTTDKKPDTGKK